MNSYSTNFAYATDYESRETKVWTIKDKLALTKKVIDCYSPRYLEITTEGKLRVRYCGAIWKEDLEYDNSDEFYMAIRFSIAEKPFKPYRCEKQLQQIRFDSSRSYNYNLVGRVTKFDLYNWEIYIKWKELEGSCTNSFCNDFAVPLVFSPILESRRYLKLSMYPIN